MEHNFIITGKYSISVHVLDHLYSIDLRCQTNVASGTNKWRRKGKDDLHHQCRISPLCKNGIIGFGFCGFVCLPVLPLDHKIYI